MRHILAKKLAAVFHNPLDNYPTSLFSANRGTTRNPLSRRDNVSKAWENESEDAKMKETVKTSRTAGYLEKIFRALNAKYFNGELEEPIITIQSTPRAYGHVTVAKAWQRGDTTRHELNIGAGTLARPIENVVATTLHECICFCKQVKVVAHQAIRKNCKIFVRTKIQDM